MKIKNFVLDLIFPRFCLACQKEGEYLCPACLKKVEILKSPFCLCQKPAGLIKAGKCKKCRTRKLCGVYSALSYQNIIAKKLIKQFKYRPFIKDLSKLLSVLIIKHFKQLNNVPLFLKQQPKRDFVILPVPLSKRRAKWRGFNQSEELAKEISRLLEIELLKDVLAKTKETLPQAELSEKERKTNISNSFACQNQSLVNNKKIILVDDVYTTGSTLEECASRLYGAGAKEVWGVVAARGY